MANKLYDLAIMTVTGTPGTGTITLGSAAVINGVTYLTFALAGVSNGDVVDYSLQDPTNGGSEVGTGTYTSSGTTLTRTPTKSTNANAAINASSATIVLISPRAETLNDASILTTNTVATARLGSGTANSTTFLRGDQTWATPVTGVSSKAISITRVLSAAAGNVSYTGVGFQPTALELSCMLGDTGGDLALSQGYTDSSKAGIATLIGVNMAAVTTSVANGAFAIYCGFNNGNAGTNFQTAVVASYDADGFTLTWAKTGSPTNTATVNILCLK